MWKDNIRAEDAADKNMAHAHFTLDTLGYRYAFRICNTYCFALQR
jgi:hypothetical protein